MRPGKSGTVPIADAQRDRGPAPEGPAEEAPVEEGSVMENWQEEPPKPVPPVTVQQLDQLAQLLKQQKIEIEEAEMLLAVKKRDFEFHKAKLLSTLREFNLPSFRTHALNFIVQKRFSVAMPKEPKSRGAFFDFLRKRGCFDELITVNANTLNAFYKEEMEAAKRRGDGAEFAVPGLQPPKMFEQLAIRRAT